MTRSSWLRTGQATLPTLLFVCDQGSSVLIPQHKEKMAVFAWHLGVKKSYSWTQDLRAEGSRLNGCGLWLCNKLTNVPWEATLPFESFNSDSIFFLNWQCEEEHSMHSKSKVYTHVQMHTHTSLEVKRAYLSTRPDRYLSATLRILLWIWLKFTRRNCACLSSSSSFSLVFAWRVRRDRYSRCLPCTPAYTCWCWKAYFIRHHVQEGVKYFVCDSNHTLHHPWNEEGFHRSGTSTEKDKPQLPANVLFGHDFGLTKEIQRKHRVPIHPSPSFLWY